MRLRELNFPIAILFRNELAGGRSSFLDRPSRFNWVRTSAYDTDRFDGAEIFDSDGNVYSVDEIFFRKPPFWRWFLDQLGNLLVLPPYFPKNVVSVDMALTVTGKLTVDEFKARILAAVLSHPSWWKRFSEQGQMERLFVGANTFPDAINKLFSLSPAANMTYRGKSKKVVDLR